MFVVCVVLLEALLSVIEGQCEVFEILRRNILQFDCEGEVESTELRLDLS
jgi:hypothetical protein